MLDEASNFLSPSTFTTTFKYLSTKPSLPSNSLVELYKREIPTSELSSINWSEDQTIPRKNPVQIQDENWFARRSYHDDESSKTKGGSASFSEFAFGLKEQHSEHEQDFTPTLYDAHYVLDWNEEIKKVMEPGLEGESLVSRAHLSSDIRISQWKVGAFPSLSGTKILSLTKIPTSTHAGLS